jgi:SNF2 family DNA or RNA helicase
MSMPCLRPSQIDGIRHILTRRASFLLWQMGAGKTRTVLEALRRERLIGGAVPIVVVAPKRVAATQRVWEADAERWGIDLSFSLVHGTAKGMRQAADADADVYVTTYDVVHRAEVQEVMARVAAAGGWLVLDESTYVKSFGQRFKAIRAIADKFSRVILLTGTPIPNGLGDLFYQVSLLDPERWGPNKQRWLNEHFSVDYTGYKWTPRAPESIYHGLEGLVHRVGNEGLPPVVVQQIVVPMTQEQRAWYTEMERDFLVEVGDEWVVAGSGGVQSLKLRQISSGFLIHTETGEVTRVSDERIRELKRLTDELAQPVLVLYEFQADRDLILESFPLAETLDSPSVVNRWNAGKVPMLVMHPKSGGHGLNLQTGGNHVVWYSLNWSLDLWLQANARLARPGQASDVVFAHVMTVDSRVERRVYSVVCEKQATEDALLDHFS